MSATHFRLIPVLVLICVNNIVCVFSLYCLRDQIHNYIILNDGVLTDYAAVYLFKLLFPDSLYQFSSHFYVFIYVSFVYVFWYCYIYRWLYMVLLESALLLHSPLCLIPAFVVLMVLVLLKYKYCVIFHISVTFYQNIRGHVQDDSNLHTEY